MKHSAVFPKYFMSIIAFAVGAIVANNYYVQPIIGLLASSLGITAAKAGLIPTATQVGYGLGVFFLIPLGDIVKVKRLTLTMIALTIAGSLGLAFSKHFTLFIFCAWITGIGASSVQVLVPYITGLVPQEKSGKAVGTLMSGLMLGIMLSRPLSSFIAELGKWHYIFLISALIMIFVWILLAKLLPERENPTAKTSYINLLKSMLLLFKEKEVLRQRAIYQFCQFSTFCLFWTSAPLYLENSNFHFSHTDIALFALVGVSGAIVAPFAGMAADAGKTKLVTMLALLISSSSYFITHFFLEGTILGIVMMVISAIALDAGVTLSMVTGQREVFAIAPELRSRLNGVYVSFIFIGGGIGSALGAWSIDTGGWKLSSIIGSLLPACALAFFMLTEGLKKKNMSGISIK